MLDTYSMMYVLCGQDCLTHLLIHSLVYSLNNSFINIYQSYRIKDNPKRKVIIKESLLEECICEKIY